jgi:hypothetical protein
MRSAYGGSVTLSRIFFPKTRLRFASQARPAYG